MDYSKKVLLMHSRLVPHARKKLQTPNTKLQKNFKIQNSISRDLELRTLRLEV
jgi:hypothetical protein